MNSGAQELASPRRVRVGCAATTVYWINICVRLGGERECFSLMVLLARTNPKPQNRFYSGSSGKTRLADQGCLPEASGQCVCVGLDVDGERGQLSPGDSLTATPAWAPCPLSGLFPSQGDCR